MRRMWRSLRRWHQSNPIGLAAAHARHHYDVPIELYRLFLDDQLQYSAPIFTIPSTIRSSRHSITSDPRHQQIAIKARHDRRRNRSGWGGFAIHRARENGRPCHCGQRVAEQINIARANAEAADFLIVLSLWAGLRAVHRPVLPRCLGWHDGTCRCQHFDEYFERSASCRCPTAMPSFTASAGCRRPARPAPSSANTLSRRYVPALSETFAATERCGLWCDDMEVLRLHYHYTVRHWRERFAKNRLGPRRSAMKILPDVGILSRCRRTRIPSRLAHGVSITAFNQARRRADHTRFHGRRQRKAEMTRHSVMSAKWCKAYGSLASQVSAPVRRRTRDSGAVTGIASLRAKNLAYR